MSPSPARLVPGDPASLSGLAAVAGRSARRLESLGDGEAAAPDTGRRSVSQRRIDDRLRSLKVSADVAARELSQLADTLQAHATDLAARRGDLARLVERAEASGLVLVDGRFVVQPGIRGTADESADARIRSGRSDAQRELETIVRAATRRRAALLSVVAESTAMLAAESARLRRG